MKMPKLRMPSTTVYAVQQRSGEACERCGVRNTVRWSLHHRQARGMGGSKDPESNLPANILLLCGSGTEGCHGWVESHRAESYNNGLLLHKWQRPDTESVELFRGTFILDNEGGAQPC